MTKKHVAKDVCEVMAYTQTLHIMHELIFNSLWWNKTLVLVPSQQKMVPNVFIFSSFQQSSVSILLVLIYGYLYYMHVLFGD